MDEDVSLFNLSPTSTVQEDKEPRGTQSPACAEGQHLLHTPDSPSPYCQDSSYSKESSAVTFTPETLLWAWPMKSHAEEKLLLFPSMEYSIIVSPAPTSTSALSTPQEMYTCVHGVTTSEMVHLVPCRSNSLKGFANFEQKDKPEEDTRKCSQIAACSGKRVEVQANKIHFCPGEKAQNEYVVSLLPQPTDGN